MTKRYLVVFIICAMTLIFSGCNLSSVDIDTSSSSDSTTISASTTIPASSEYEITLDYDIAESSYSQNADAHRRTIRVTISKSDADALTESSAKEFLTALAEQQMDAHSPDALCIFLYSGTVTDTAIAKVVYAPNGVWGDANYSADNDYTGYEYSYNFWLT